MYVTFVSIMDKSFKKFLCKITPFQNYPAIDNSENTPNV